MSPKIAANLSRIENSDFGNDIGNVIVIPYVPMIGSRVSGAVTSGVPDHPTLGDASTPRGPKDASRPVCRRMGVPMIRPWASCAVTSGVPDHHTPDGAPTRPADPTKSTPLPFTRTNLTDLTDRGKGKVSGTWRQNRGLFSSCRINAFC